MDFRKLFLLLQLFLLLTVTSYAQLVGSGHATTQPTQYTNGTPNDVIYIYCATPGSTTTGTLTATPNGGTAPYTYTWYQYSTATNGWAPLGAPNTATRTGLGNGGYFVTITDANGVSRGCFRAWIFINETVAEAGNTITACGQFTLQGTANPVANFVYYNPPPNPMTVSASSQISVCFTATHTYVSDLAFYLIGPPSCGSPIVTLSPNPGAIGQGSICNSGNNVSNLCFSNTSTSNLNVCTAGTPLTGTYGSYGATPTPINWAPLYGCDASSGGWSVQIYDCIGSDVGAFTNATISINGNTQCGPLNVNYNSGTINSAINDNSCTAASASIYQVPASPTLTTPITLTNTITSVSWSNGATTLNSTVNPAPVDNTWYYLTVTDNFGCTHTDSVQYINSCVCTMTNLNASIGACHDNSVFDLTGTVQFQYPPTTGQLIIQDCNGNSATYNPPFVSPLNFSINDIPANGQNCGITASFTASPSCSISLNYQNTQPCVCDAAIGTFTLSTSGNVSNNANVLCYGDQFTFNNNVGFVPPNEALYPPNAGGYQPGIGWLVYSCPPSVGLNYEDDEDVAADPCFVTYFAGPNFSDVNDMYWINALPAGTFTNNTVYFVPITFYNLDEGLYTYTNGTLPCYEMGEVTAFQFLPQITRTVTPNCQAGTVSVQVQGGAPAVNGSNFTGSNLTPSHANFVTGSVGNNGIIVVGGLQNGDNYSFQIADQNGCPITITGIFQGVNASTFTYPQAAYCKDEANPTPTITGVTGGTFSGSAGLVINGTSGVVNIAATPPGTYTVTYTSPGAPCNSSTTFQITINPLPVVAANPVTICNGESATLNATGATTYTWAPAIGLNTTTGSTVISNVTANQTYTITGVITATGCTSTGTVNVVVNPLPAPIINGQVEYCVGFNSTLQTTQNYSSYSWSTGATTPTAQVTVANNPVQVTVTNAFGCQAISPAFNVVENTFTVNNSQIEICQGQTATIHGVVRTTSGVYSLTVPGANGCDSTSNVTLVVNPLPVINAGLDQVLCDGEQVTLNATGAPQIVWSPAATNNVAFTQSVGTQIYTATGTDLNGCVNTDQVQVIVRPLPVINNVNAQTICNSTNTTAVNFTSSVAGTTYSWVNSNPSIGLPASGNGNINVFNAINTGTTVQVATITVTPTAAGCVGPALTFTYTVMPSPSATISGTTEVCVDGTAPQVEFNGLTGTAPFTITYNINGGANQTITTTGNPATINAPTGTVGTFVYNLVSVQEAGNSCQAVATGNATITINALPPVNAGIDVDVCLNNPITLTATGAVNYTWSPSITNGVEFTPTSSGTYTVTGTDANGCVNTDQVEVTVNVPVIVDAGPNQTICIGDSVVLSAIISDPTASIVWSDGVVNDVSFVPTQTLQYTVVSTDVNGCVSSDQVTVIVNPLPIVEAGNTVYGCSTDLIVLTGSGAGANGTYIWDNGVIDGVPFNPDPNVVIYHLSGTDENGCTNVDSVYSKVEAIPNVTFYVEVDQNCSPVTATFYNTTTPAGVNCIWNFDNGSTVSGCGPITQVFNYPGSYGASLQLETPINGCIGTSYLADLVVVDALPVAHFVPNPQVGTQVENQIMFNNQSYGATSYVWDFGDNSAPSSAINPVHTYSEEIDFYTVMLVAISDAGCKDTAYSTVQIVEELIYYIPNTFTPDSDQFNETFKPIFTYGFDPFDYTLLIFNRWGEMIFESHNVEIGWGGRYGVDGKICQDGTYTWKIEVKTSRNDERKTFVGHVNLMR